MTFSNPVPPPDSLRQAVIDLAESARPDPGRVREVVSALFDALERGVVRAAEPVQGEWRVHQWVKQGILLAFRHGRNESSGSPPTFSFRDRDTLPTWDPASSERDVRIVPGGTTVRRGAFLDEGVVVMPPAYVNVGAWVGAGCMVDSHALVGSCAQIEAGVHLSAAVQVGGVLEPIGSLPVIVEQDAFVGGNCGIYEGCRVGQRAVLAPGVILTRAVPVFDLIREQVHRAGDDGVLRIPAGAVVVPGSRPAPGQFAATHGLQMQAPLIVKYRDARTDAALALEEVLR